MTEHFDIIIIGGGNAGFGVSAIANQAGKSIAFIEELEFGGTCPNRGCTPKKVLVAAAHTLHEIEQAAFHGITVSEPKLDWEKLISRKDDMVGFIPGAMQGVAEKRGKVFYGRAKFVGPNSVEVGGTVIGGENIVIATGSKPRPLNIPGAELMITSDEVLSQNRLPDEAIFIGGGVIAMEFSHVYARAGVKVTILEVAPQLLPRIDSDAVAAIRAESERLGITIKTGVEVKAVTQSGERLEVAYNHEGENFTAATNSVINGAGRIANVDQLDLDQAGVTFSGVHIEVDDYLRSVSNPSIWVAGDALVQSPQLSPLATYEGRIVGHNIVFGPEKSPDYDAVPSAVYTIPALATVGLTQQEAEAQNLNINVTTSDMTGWFSGKSYAETVAWAKVITDKDTDQIVGAHLVGHHGEDLIHVFALAMRHEISASALKESPMAFPTFASDLKNII
ncbi:MAG: NAD(P)/FAD-dependent oxidoreductase [Erythrobacter sp.]